MVAPNFESPRHGPSPSHVERVFLAYRRNELFDRLLPEVARLVEKELQIPLQTLAFDAATTPPAMQDRLRRAGHGGLRGELLVTDISVRRGIRALNGTGQAMLDAAHSGVLLDRSLAEAVKELIRQELRRPNFKRHTAPGSDLVTTGMTNLQAEAVFFEELLRPLVRGYPQFQFVIAAPKLLHHVPFVTYIGALQEAYLKEHPEGDPFITDKLLAWEHPQSILSAARIPEEVLVRLRRVTSEPVVHPCDWIRDRLIAVGCHPSQIVVVESIRDLDTTLSAPEQLRVLLADRHLVECGKLAGMFAAEGLDLPEIREAYCLAGPTFRLPIESLVTDLADRGLLENSSLLSSDKVRPNLARLILTEIRALVEQRSNRDPPADEAKLPPAS